MPEDGLAEIAELCDSRRMPQPLLWLRFRSTGFGPSVLWPSVLWPSVFWPSVLWAQRPLAVSLSAACQAEALSK